MASIKFEPALVYFAPTKGRRYLTKRAAASAEAGAIIDAKYPAEKTEYDDAGRVTYSGFHWSSDKRLNRLHARLVRMIFRQLKKSQGEKK